MTFFLYIRVSGMGLLQEVVFIIIETLGAITLPRPASPRPSRERRSRPARVDLPIAKREKLLKESSSSR
ncbi:hypothetical protein RJ55_06802 [Drechmeria coniospora]|nr:hypothetical protein RJ55_06802 [Drechmeria coniospora]